MPSDTAPLANSGLRPLAKLPRIIVCPDSVEKHLELICFATALMSQPKLKNGLLERGLHLVINPGDIIIDILKPADRVKPLEHAGIGRLGLAGFSRIVQ